MTNRIPKHLLKTDGIGRIRRVWAAALILVLMAVSGCGRSEEAAVDTQTYLYFRDADGLGAAKEPFVPSGDDKASQASSYLTALNKAPAGKMIEPLLPDNVELNSSRLQGSVLTLDFSSGYLSLDKTEEVLVRSGYVRTLIQVPGIDYVVFSVEGKPLLRSDGSEIGPMNGDTFIENAGKSVNAYLHHNITLYFADESGTYLVPEGRSIYYNSNKPLEWAIVERLIAGPKAEGSYRTVAAETQIIGVTTQDRTCYVNLTEAFNSNHPAVSDEVTIYSIVNSLTRNCDVDNVQIAVGGNTNVTFGSSIELSTLFTTNKDLIRESR